MTLGGKQMKPVGLLQWSGILIASAGAVLTVYAVALAPALVGAHLPTALSTDAHGLLLAGITCLLGGGILVQITWRTQHG
jgi:hypothetical protein